MPISLCLYKRWWDAAHGFILPVLSCLVESYAFFLCSGVSFVSWLVFGIDTSFAFLFSLVHRRIGGRPGQEGGTKRCLKVLGLGCHKSDEVHDMVQFSSHSLHLP